MHLHQLLRQRDALLRQTRLANVAFAHHRLEAFATRIRRAGLRGAVVLRAGDTLDGRPWPELEPLEGSPAVLEEHFLEEDLLDLSDILAFLEEGGRRDELRFRLEDLAGVFLPRLRRELEHAGVTLPPVGTAQPGRSEARS